MLSIKEVNYFTKLVKEKKASPVECPFDILREKHLVYSKLDENEEVFFKCIDCQVTFKLGYNQEKYIKETIDKNIQLM